MKDLADLVAAQIARWDGRLEADLFGTEVPAEVAAVLHDHVREVVAPPESAIFYVSGVGVVAGLRLVDGQEVVVKVHRWQADAQRLAAVQQVQTHVADKGVPVPRPLAPPAELGTGFATVEEHRPGGMVDGRTAATRTTMAHGLHTFLEATADIDADVGRALLLRPPTEPLWPEPHSVRFDFEATSEGAEWIDELGEHARRRLHAAAVLPDRIGHLDWRVQNLGWDADGRITAVYDSDAIGKAPEAVVVGNTAGGFCIDWEADHADPPPTVDQMRAFVADYETARGSPFTEEEREALDAANLAMIAYNARCQHSDLTLEPRFGDSRVIGWFRLLRDRGERAF